MSIRFKLILSFLAVALIGIAIVALLAGRVTADQFGRFVFRESGEQVASQLAESYLENGGWRSIRPGQFGGGMMRGQGHMGGVGMGPTGPLVVVDADGRVVVPGGGFELGQRLPPAAIDQGIPVEAEGEQVGTVIAVGPTAALITPAGQDFLNRVNRALVFGGLGAVIVAVFLAVLLSGQLTGSLRKLTDATRSLAAGQLGRQVQINSSDEVGELAEAFNQMSVDLAEAEDMRKQMSADIAHELRTPLSLILGQSEAMLDEVVPTSPENLQVLHQEARRLNRIVEDLRTLSLAEAGELTIQQRPCAPGTVIQQAVKARRSLANARQIEMKVAIPKELPEVAADPDRLEQALGNLMDNALRFTPPGGMILLTAEADRSSLSILVEDEGPGIDPGDLPHVFDRFYRADEARSRERGGSGLGLAIARSIARSHGGELTAGNRPEGGASFRLTLPLV